MIHLSEEPYDDPVALGLVAALNAEINHRYASDMVSMTDEERAAEDAATAAEVTAAMVRRPRGAFLVARLDGAPAGCGAVKPLGDGTDHGEVKRMYTAPAARRRGVSRTVLLRLEAVAAELGYRRLQLETGTAQPEAIALYEAAGWTRISPYGRYQASPDSVCFAKDIPVGDVHIAESGGP